MDLELLESPLALIHLNVAVALLAKPLEPHKIPLLINDKSSLVSGEKQLDIKKSIYHDLNNDIVLPFLNVRVILNSIQDLAPAEQNGSLKRV